MVENLIKKNLIPISIVIAGLLVAGGMVYVNQQKETENKQILSSQQVGEKVINYINENILQGQAVASLKEIVQENGLYRIRVKINDREFPSYVTLDGKLLFPEAIDLEKKSEGSSEPPTSQPEPKETPQREPASLESFAKCLTQKGLKFYGSRYCGWCKKQKELFGQAEKFLPYIECIDEKTQQMTSECQSADLTGFPTWEVPEKGKISGYKTLEELAELSGCQL